MHSDSVGLGWSYSVCISDSSQVMLVLMVCGPHAEQQEARSAVLQFDPHQHCLSGSSACPFGHSDVADRRLSL